MTDNKTGKDCSTGACPVEKKDGKLVKSTDLPLLGNPYPPKDVIQNDTPSSLELSIASIRTSIQPFMAPVCKAYQKTSDVLAIGVAHSQSTFATIRESQGSFGKVLFISCSGFLGLAIARRKGIFKKLVLSSLLAGGATTYCYPQDVREKADIIWIMAKNKLPSLKEQYGSLVSGTAKSQDESDKK